MPLLPFDELRLSELIKPEMLRRLCASLKDLHGVEALAMDLDGRPLGGGSRDQLFCAGIRRGGKPNPVCDSCATLFAAASASAGKIVRSSCASGVDYIRARIDNQLEPLGYLLLGPFAEEAWAPSYLAQAPEGRNRIALLPTPQADKVAWFFCNVLEEIVTAHYERYLSTRLTQQHLADGLGERLEKEQALQAYERTLESSKDLRELF